MDPVDEKLMDTLLIGGGILSGVIVIGIVGYYIYQYCCCTTENEFEY